MDRDKRWLKQYFADPDGNLYESEGGGPDTSLELRTNKSEGDTSDLAAVAAVVATASDADYWAEIEELVDVDELLTYWAIEALTAHWDGYVYDLSVPGRVPTATQPLANPWPNNFYAYHDPETGKFVLIRTARISPRTRSLDHLRRRSVDAGPLPAQSGCHHRRETVG